MPLPMTVVTFVDAEGTEFPVTVVGKYESVGDAVAAANGVLTKAIWEGDLHPTMPITVKDGAYEWGTSNDA